MADLPAAFWIVTIAVVLVAGVGLYCFLRLLPFLDRGDD